MKESKFNPGEHSVEVFRLNIAFHQITAKLMLFINPESALNSMKHGKVGAAHQNGGEERFVKSV